LLGPELKHLVSEFTKGDLALLLIHLVNLL